MRKTDLGMGMTGYCLHGHHAKCRHVTHLSSGKTYTCPCACHDAAPKSKGT